ncbi:ABC transporter ATP-binding protein [Microlunatus elymi]|uniref:ABC transporter ATP-binding protein n=1 Tax=Microlunatus elymi TaxID=2596828 RepID=A0A516Q0P2_9ACTN|nr:ABC transporter ATP-binding protein [Microlunatus elymi]QDP96990.1 ABC transporter ATP-binding protein [Microlunatus elymi]
MATVIALVRNAFRVSPGAVLASSVASIVAAMLAVLVPILVGRAVGGAPDAVRGGPHPGYLLLLAILLVALLAGNLINLVGNSSAALTEGRLEQDSDLRIGWALSRHPELSSVDHPDVASRLQQIRPRLWEIRMATRLLLGPAISQLPALIGSAITLAVMLAWWAPLPLLATYAVAAEVTRRSILAQFDVFTGQTDAQKHAQYAFEQGMGKAAKEIRIFGLSDYLRRRAWDFSTTAYRPYWAMRRRKARSLVALSAVRVGVAVVVAAYAGWRAQSGTLSLTAFATALPVVLTMANSDAWMFAQLQRGISPLQWLNRLAPADQFDRAAPELSSAVSSRARLAERSPSAAEPAVATPAEAAPQIVFDEVSFGYPTSNKMILKDFSLELPAGAATALVGVNGAGKSTLVKLLTGGYLPSRGRILIDGQDLAGFDEQQRAAWQRRIAPITQDFLRLPLRAGDNVELGSGRAWSGRIDGPSPDITAELEQIATRAGIDDLIAKLPDGWATPLDKSLPGGRDLSGGEWQRIGLARALRAVDSGARLLILDEPAAALDVESEARLVDSYLDITRRLTSLIISHRFSVVRPVPIICVLERGRIVERGSHQELMTIPGGRYRTLFTLQASRYLAAVDQQEVSSR